MGSTRKVKSLSEVILLSILMLFVWTRSDMWSRSLWINETDTMSYAVHGIEGFGFGYGGYIFSLHILLDTFGEIDFAFKGLSLICSALTMIIIYQISEENFGYGTGLISSFIFVWSAYSIEFGMQVREYAVHSFVMMLITMWCFRVSRGQIESEANLPDKYSFMASFGVWYVSVHWFCMIYLFLLFASYFCSYIACRKLNDSDGSSRFPRVILPPMITMLCILSLQIISMVEGIYNSIEGEHHLGGGSVPLVILPPLEFMSKISSGSVVLSLLILIAVFVGVLGAFNDIKKKTLALENVLIITILLVWTILCISQYQLHGLIVERYFYFWFPILCVFSGSTFSKICAKIDAFASDSKKKIGKLFPYFAILTIFISVDITPESTYYGSMREAFEMVDDEVGESEFSIISRPPKHILDYYLEQFELEPEFVIGAWHINELDKDAISDLDSEVIVVMALQGGWILEESRPILEESGYVIDPDLFQEEGDTVWVWRK